MSDSNKSDCTQIGEMLGAFRDMELSLAEAELVESHLTSCSACRHELEEIEKVVSALQSLPAVPERDFTEAIEARINRSLIVSADGGNGAQASLSEAPSLALVPATSNVVNMPVRRRSRRPLMAAAALLLLGFVAARTLAPQPVANIANKTPGTVDVASRADHAKTVTNASGKGAPALNEDIVALYEEEGSNNSVSDVGISTNEDGLYAIKM